MGIPSVACSAAIWRGSDGVEDRLGCCLTLCFSSPPSPICLGNHAPRCREEGRVWGAGSEENPAEGETEIGKQEGTGGMDIKSGKVTNLSGSFTSSVPIQFKEGHVFVLFFSKSVIKCDIHFLP